MARAHISLKTKLASALLELVRWDDEECTFVKVIPYAESKTMTADQIINRFELHHNIRHAEGGTDDPWNLTWMPTGEHRERTAKIDIPQIAKGKRIRRGNEEFARRILSKSRGEPKPRSRWGSRKLQSRGFRQQHQ